MSIVNDLNLVRSKPIASFWYKGTHSHPIKRTVLLTEANSQMIKGYEVREGNDIKDIDNAPVKTYRLDKIATTSQLRKDNPLRNKKNQSTLLRMSITNMDV